jgi:hypothetical protein
MKTNKTSFILILMTIAMSLSSCGAYYNYIQVLTAKPMNNTKQTTAKNGGMVYEDENCAIFYKFWSNGGDAGFEFYNKSKSIIYIDLSKTFFIKNGVAYDYYTDKTVTNTKSSHTTTTKSETYGLSATRSYSASISQHYSGHRPATTYAPTATNVQVSGGISATALKRNTTSTTTSTGNSTSVSVASSPILAIPPKSSKVVRQFSLISHEYISCDLQYYPAENDKITFTKENSPLVFSNYITFKVGEKTKTVENSFYVAEICNYVKYDVTDYIKREKICENILTPEEIKSQNQLPDLYDAYIVVGNAGSFYTTYSVYSKSKLYERAVSGFYWNNALDGYIKNPINTYDEYNNNNWNFLSPSKGLMR